LGFLVHGNIFNLLWFFIISWF